MVNPTRLAVLALVVAASCYQLPDQFPCAADKTCPDGFGCLEHIGCIATQRCEPVSGAEDCAEGQKCGLVGFTTGNGNVCVAAGPKQLDDSCQRAAFGIDDCADGLACLKDAARGLTCQELCPPYGSCAVDHECVYSDAVGFDGGHFLLCAETCTGAFGTCGTGRTCRQSFIRGNPNNLIAVCSSDGDQPLGAGCNDNDRCAHGLACVVSARSTDTAECRVECNQDADCGSSSACINGANHSPIGLCSCDPFKAGACAPGTDCKLASYSDYGLIGTCTQTGAGSAGASCTVDTDCAAGFACSGSACIQQCNSSHPCPGTMSCNNSGTPTPWGFCF